MDKLSIGIYIFDHVEVLDFSGPFEVFSTASRVFEREHPNEVIPFEVFTIGEADNTPCIARGGLTVVPQHSIQNHPSIDVLVIPGGVVDAERSKQHVLSWIQSQAKETKLVASVCTGAFILGDAELIKHQSVTTHWEDVPMLRSEFPETTVVSDVPWVDEGHLITSAGISAGIDMSLYIVGRLAGNELAELTAKQMQYRWVNEL